VLRHILRGLFLLNVGACHKCRSPVSAICPCERVFAFFSFSHTLTRQFEHFWRRFHRRTTNNSVHRPANNHVTRVYQSHPRTPLGTLTEPHCFFNCAFRKNGILNQTGKSILNEDPKYHERRRRWSNTTPRDCGRCRQQFHRKNRVRKAM